VEDLIAGVTAFIGTHGAWAGPTLGLLCFGESLALVGLFIPATTLMIAVGGLIGAGTLEPLPLLIWSMGGSLLGDWLSYAVGRRIGPSIYRRWPLNRHRPMVARTRLFFRRFGFASVFLGRFLGPIRATIPLVAGVVRMESRPFQLANIASAILWVPALLAPGFVATRHFGAAQQLNEMHLIGLVGFSLVLTVLASFVAARLLGGNRKRRRQRAAQTA
jgi:membrane protein DedA with SNARE-associated domain